MQTSLKLALVTGTSIGLYLYLSGRDIVPIVNVAIEPEIEEEIENLDENEVEKRIQKRSIPITIGMISFRHYLKINLLPETLTNKNKIYEERSRIIA
jgi:hypothetical protein